MKLGAADAETPLLLLGALTTPGAQDQRDRISALPGAIGVVVRFVTSADCLATPASGG